MRRLKSTRLTLCKIGITFSRYAVSPRGLEIGGGGVLGRGFRKLYMHSSASLGVFLWYCCSTVGTVRSWQCMATERHPFPI